MFGKQETLSHKVSSDIQARIVRDIVIKVKCWINRERQTDGHRASGITGRWRKRGRRKAPAEDLVTEVSSEEESVQIQASLSSAIAWLT